MLFMFFACIGNNYFFTFFAVSGDLYDFRIDFYTFRHLPLDEGRSRKRSRGEKKRGTRRTKQMKKEKNQKKEVEEVK